MYSPSSWKPPNDDLGRHGAQRRYARFELVIRRVACSFIARQGNVQVALDKIAVRSSSANQQLLPIPVDGSFRCREGVEPKGLAAAPFRQLLHVGQALLLGLVEERRQRCTQLR